MRFCYICKQEIDPERAESVPDTKLCTKHAEAIRAYGGEFVTWSTPIRTDKGGIKTNVGGYEHGKRVNQEALDRLRDEYLEGNA